MVSNARTMEPYTDIAPVYDYLLRHVDYQEWYEYISSVMMRHCDAVNNILELGCGTGRFGSKFSNDGYTIFGIDKSLDMLLVAKTRAFLNFRILCSDITNFRLAKKMDFIFSVHDTMNYLLDYADILNMFRCVRETMHGESVFMFDITTEHNIYENFDGKTSQYQLRSSTVEWSNRYDAGRKLITSTLRLRRDGKTSVEEHVQRIYASGEIRTLLAEGGLALLGEYGDYTFEPPRDNTVMINFVARKA
jgi:SAM-dependent methyltransferase